MRHSPMGGAGRRGFRAAGMPVTKAKDVKGTLKRLWGYIKQQKIKLFAVVLAIIASSGANVASTMLIGRAIDKYIVRLDFPGLARFSIVIVAVYALGACASWFQSYIMVGIAQRTTQSIRRDLFNCLHRLPLNFFDSHAHGDLMSRLTNDVDNIGQTLNQSLVQLFSVVLTISITIFAMLSISPLLSIIPFVIMPIGIALSRFFVKRAKKYFSMQQKDLGELNGVIEETISGQKVVKVFGRERIIMQKFQKKNDDLRISGNKAQIYSSFIMPIMNSLNNLSYASVALFGGFMLIKGFGSLTIGKISNMLTYAKQFARPINELAGLLNILQSAIAAAERVFEVMETEPEVMAGKHIKKQTLRGEVVFKDVTFGYSKENLVLKDVNIHAKPGETIALVGPTGAGKTTVVNLLTRFYDVDKGTITLDGEDIQSLARNALRQCLGMVIQETYLFSATIRENIRYGRLDATDEEVEQAARIANVHRFITNLPKGYDTVLSDAGEGISQGQRQLIAIARVMLANPSILILDEATSNIDTRTEKHIQDALLTLMHGRTSFVIAHRLSTIRDADKILVINDGQIIEEGSHESLYAQKGFYYNLYTSQFKRVLQE